MGVIDALIQMKNERINIKTAFKCMCTQGSAKPEPKASPVDVATTDMMKKYNVRVAKFLH